MQSFFHALTTRQVGENVKTDALGWSELSARKLRIDAVLKGHRGCVNRLAWDEHGRLLASASDDLDIILWPYPPSPSPSPASFPLTRSPIAVPTLHEGNIFGVAFLPQADSRKIVSGAMDHGVQLHTLAESGKNSAGSATSASSSGRAERPHPQRPRRLQWRPGAGGVVGESEEENDDDEEQSGGGRAAGPAVADCHTQEFYCHRGRVKQVEVTPEEPPLFWSAAEDGCVRQFDIRMSAASQQRFASPNVLLALRSPSDRRFLELKSLAIDPVRPHRLAVAASDADVRIFDRRKLTAGTVTDASRAARAEQGLLLRLAPPHAALGPGARGGPAVETVIHPTHVSFGSTGGTLLATYHGDHAYAWDTSTASTPSNASCVTMRQPPSADSFPPASPPSVSREIAAMAFHRPRPTPMPSRTFSNAGILSYSAASTLGPGMLPLAAERARLDGNLALSRKRPTAAIGSYSRGLRAAPGAASLLTSRALALLLRNWVGDRVEALRDAEEAVLFEPGNVEALLRRAQALRDCELPKSAMAALRICRVCSRSGGGGGNGSRGEFEEDMRKLEARVSWDLEKAVVQAQLQRERQESRREQRRRQGLNLHRRRRRSDSSSAEAAGEPQIQPQQQQENQQQQQAAPSPITVAADAGVAAVPSGPSAEILGEAPAPSPPQLLEEPSGFAAYRESDDEGSGEEDGLEDAYQSGRGSEDASTPPYSIDDAFAAALEADLVAIENGNCGSSGGPGPSAAAPAGASSQHPLAWLWGALPGTGRLLQRYVGHCNLQTDIKEAAFLGHDDSLVACGSDDGRLFLYAASDGTCLRAIPADEDVLNCIRPHPILPILATSGIDATVKLWTPEAALTEDYRGELEAEEACEANQGRLKEGARMQLGLDPRTLALLSRHPELLQAIATRVGALQEGGEGEEAEEGEGGVEVPRCRLA